MKPRNRLLTIYAAIVYVFLFAPIVVLIVFSFNDSKRSVNWKGFTLDWYPTLFTDHALVDALSVTLRLALVVVIISTVVGTLLGLALARVRFRGRAATETLLLLPMVTPEIIMGLSLLVFFSAALGWHGSFTQLVFAQVTFCISYVAIVVRARAAGMSAQLEEAARDLGASALGAFRYVTLPLIFPAILSGALLSFALSFDDYVVTTFNAGVGSSTLPLYIYGRVKFGVTPEINAISTIIVTVTAVAVLVAWYTGQRRNATRAVTEDESETDLAAPPPPATPTSRAGAGA